MIDKTVGHYKIVAKLGQGGMGVVYRAEDTKLGRTVALKFLPPHLGDKADRERFLQEARAASALDHASICTVYEINESQDGRLYIAMAYCEGKTLKDIIADGPLSFDAATRITMGIGGGLARAHEHDITHRDVKPANIIVDLRGDAKIIDFGVAKLARGTGLTRTGSTVGTVAYMSPEQARGDRVDHQTDVWALGVILYEMVTGRRPFAGEFEQAVVYFILNENPPPASSVRPDLPAGLDAVISRALAKERTERYERMQDFLVDLRSISTATSMNTALGIDVTRTMPRRSVRWWIPALIAAVIVGGVYGGWRIRAPGDTPDTPAQVVGNGTDAAKNSQISATTSGPANEETSAPPPPPAPGSASPLPVTTAPQGMEPPPASEVIAPPTKSPPPKTRTKPDVDPTEVRRAEAARESAERAADRARVVGAPAAVPQLFEQADDLVSSGDDALTAGEPIRALKHFENAAQAFDRAGGAARDAVRERRERLAAVQIDLAALRPQLTPSLESMESYRTAKTDDGQGGTALSRGDTAAAIASFERAKSAYLSALNAREQQHKDIAVLIKSYEKALGHRDIEALGKLFVSFDAEKRRGWEQFFSRVKLIKATLTVRQLNFIPSGAESMVAAHLEIDDNPSDVQWAMTLKETVNGWRVHEVHQRD